MDKIVPVWNKLLLQNIDHLIPNSMGFFLFVFLIIKFFTDMLSDTLKNAVWWFHDNIYDVSILWESFRLCDFITIAISDLHV